MINILEFVDALGLGGTEKALQIFSKNIDRGVFNVLVCCRREGERAELLKGMGVKVVCIGDNESLLTKLVSENEIQILHIHRGGWEEEHFAIKAAHSAGVPIIVETNVFGASENSYTGKLIDRHLFISKMCALRYMKKLNLNIDEFWKNCRVLYYPVDLDEFRCNEYSGRVNEQPVVGEIRRKDLGKWSNATFEMLVKLCGIVPSVKMRIVGVPDEIIGSELFKSERKTFNLKAYYRYGA